MTYVITYCGEGLERVSHDWWRTQPEELSTESDEGQVPPRPNQQIFMKASPSPPGF